MIRKVEMAEGRGPKKKESKEKSPLYLINRVTMIKTRVLYFIFCFALYCFPAVRFFNKSTATIQQS